MEGCRQGSLTSKRRRQWRTVLFQNIISHCRHNPPEPKALDCCCVLQDRLLIGSFPRPSHSRLSSNRGSSVWGLLRSMSVRGVSLSLFHLYICGIDVYCSSGEEGLGIVRLLPSLETRLKFPAAEFFFHMLMDSCCFRNLVRVLSHLAHFRMLLHTCPRASPQVKSHLLVYW